MTRDLRHRLETLSPDALAKLETVGFDSNRMRRPLPPLQTLVAFEASARLQSFTGAALELNLTQPAISQQVKLLEHRLGTDLFLRQNNRIALTEAGEQLARTVGALLLDLSESVHELSEDRGRTNLTVSLLPSFATTWFAHRCGRFITQNPGLDLIALSTIAKTEFGQEDVDVAIRWGPGGTVGVYEERLFGEEHLFAASPTVAATLGDSIDALHDVPFLHDTRYSEWRKLIEVNGGNPDEFEDGPYFGDASATQAAIAAGHGVGAVRSILADQLLTSGDLVRLPFKPVEGPYAYYFLCPESRMEQPKVACFLNWLREEAQRP